LFSVKNGQYFGPKKFFLRLPAQQGAAAKAAAYSSKRVSGETRQYLWIALLNFESLNAAVED
jgi:hypothetical protein